MFGINKSSMNNTGSTKFIPNTSIYNDSEGPLVQDNLNPVITKLHAASDETTLNIIGLLKQFIPKQMLNFKGLIILISLFTVLLI